MNTRLILMPNKLSVVGVAGEMAANDASPFAAKRSGEHAEDRAQRAMSRAAALVSQMADRKVAKLLPEPVKTTVPLVSRSAALVTGLDAKAKEFVSIPPSESEHLSAFESVNRLIAQAHQEFEQKWAPVAEFKVRAVRYSDDDLRDVIAQAGNPTEFEAESEHIKKLSSESTAHLAALSDHVTAYQKAHGADDSIRETAERVQASLADLSPVNATSVAVVDEDDEEEENAAGTSYGPGHASGESLSESVKRAMAALREIIQKFIDLVLKMLGIGTKPA